MQSADRESRGSRSKSCDACTCIYCKKVGHIKAQCGAIQAKNEKTKKYEHKGKRTEEVDYCGSISAAEVTRVDLNILTVEGMTDPEVLITTAEATSWLLSSGGSFHVTPYRLEFRQYTIPRFDPMRVGNLQHCVVVSTSTVELNLSSGSTLVLEDVRRVPERRRSLILVLQLDEPDFALASLLEVGHSTKGTSSLLAA